VITVRVKIRDCFQKDHNWLNDRLSEGGLPPTMLRTGGTLQWFDAASNEMVWEYYEPEEMQLPFGSQSIKEGAYYADPREMRLWRDGQTFQSDTEQS
jgi:hypothetical protein